MPECARYHDVADNSADCDYDYCDDCLDQFTEIEQRGVVVEHDIDSDVHVIVTANDEAFDGGTEQSQIDGLAHGKYTSNDTGHPTLFKCNRTGSRWRLDEYLQAHSELRQQVQKRLRRVPNNSSDRAIDHIRDFL